LRKKGFLGEKKLPSEHGENEAYRGKSLKRVNSN